MTAVVGPLLETRSPAPRTKVLGLWIQLVGWLLLIGGVLSWGVILFWDSGYGRDISVGVRRWSVRDALLLSGGLIGLALMLFVGPIVYLRSRNMDRAKVLIVTAEMFGCFLLVGWVFSWLAFSREDVAKEIQTADSAHVRSITLRPFAANMSPGWDLPDLFTVPVRIEDPQVISRILQELQAPTHLQSSTQYWRCRMDLDFGDHQRYCYVTSQAPDKKRKGVRILITDSPDPHASACESLLRYPLGVLLESLAQKK